MKEFDSRLQEDIGRDTFSGGSQRSFLSEKEAVCERLQLPCFKKISYSSFKTKKTSSLSALSSFWRFVLLLWLEFGSGGVLDWSWTSFSLGILVF